MLNYESIYFDRNDYRLVELFNDIISRKEDQTRFRNLLSPYLKPHGIKELAAPYGIRVAYAAFNLLESLKSEGVDDRLKALTALRNEVLASSKTSMRNNRARVLIQIAKEIIRARGDEQKQLRLAHNFRSTSFGKSSFIREQLKKYHLLEMPEEWNQLTFDDRVHDANSKGRKSASHLIMDAWIKGIRSLRVVYYDFVTPEIATELYSAAAILGIDVEFGIEFRAVMYGRYVKLIWNPKNILDQKDLDDFFSREKVIEIMANGRKAQEFRAKYIRKVADRFNQVHRKSIEKEIGVQLPEISYEEMLTSIKSRTPALTHLGKYIHETAMPYFERHAQELADRYHRADSDEKRRIEKQFDSINLLDPDTITARYLSPEANPELENPDVPAYSKDRPEFLNPAPAQLAEILNEAYPSSAITMILEDIEIEDAVELVYDGQGLITHFELINLKNISENSLLSREAFNEFQDALNSGNVIVLKRIIRDCVERVSASGGEDRSRVEKLLNIQKDIDELKNAYKHRKIKTRIGSGSTGGSLRAIGMGFAVAETLPLKAQQEIVNVPDRKCLPISANIAQRLEYTAQSKRSEPACSAPSRIGDIPFRIKSLPLLRDIFLNSKKKWKIISYSIDSGCCGNISPLGGISQHSGNGFQLEKAGSSSGTKPDYMYVNSTIKNIIKIIIGFIPAFLTFYLTKDWWVLASFGGLIWFSITGVRNIIQSVLGGGGLKRSPYLAWNDFVNWNRISDSLLYTGFSVPLLDWLCKSVVLDRMFGINATTDPTLLYTIMALTNGIYISSHNLWRELPKAAAAGNLFRSVISIPIAIAFSGTVGLLLRILGVTGIDGIIQQWAAVISKLASDCAAGFLEGLADRRENIRARSWDYDEKVRQVLDFFSEMEIRHPNADLLHLMNHPEEFIQRCRTKNCSDASILMANALDLLYLRMFQPRSEEALQQAITRMSPDEKIIFKFSQQILREMKSVSHIIVDGLVGNNFSRPLSFYLRRHEDYLKELDRLIPAGKTM
ncbi:hypothetical protein [Maridesulfovibrio sp.]|uniref:hypothetical protein n=1 Tax=Maridesulfovibrio sp. TaxID=2795000 RepID=UPI002A18D8D4|nr:hypothetical protein [Maridesulfovibrio sp.]